MKDFDRERNYDSLLDGEWTCLNHRGVVSVMEQMLGHVATGFVLTLAPFPVLVPVYFLLISMNRFLRQGRLHAKGGSLKLMKVRV